METTHLSPQKRLADTQLIVGYALLLVSCCIYSLTEYFDPNSKGDLFSLFMLHYVLAVGYVFYLLVSGRFGIRKSFCAENIHYTVVLMNLFLVSAYALNRELVVFEDSVDWLCIYLILTAVVLLSFRYFTVLPKWVNRIQLVLMGSSIVFYIYLSFYIGEIYLYGSIGAIFFGIGAHAFVPMLFLITCLFLLKHSCKINSTQLAWLGVGGALNLITVSLFVLVWNHRVSVVSQLSNQSVLYPESELPVWAKVGQSVSSDWITLCILKEGLVYTTKDRFIGRSFVDRNWEEARKHDPLVFIASFISTISLSQEDRIKILQSISDSRHQSNERLWSGDNLKTSYVVTDIDIYPALRLAYTEKYLTIKNNVVRRTWWGNTEEAIYTFQLPEGSVVTSLSLWINGREEKAILTSKQKAAEAYNTIVGKESRDPSVVHWQEGNTITVRVFPCTDKEERKFKIGITSPLAENQGKILYQNISFKGPSPISAPETMRVRFIGNANKISLPDRFVKNKNGDYLLEHLYDPDFELALDALPVSKNNQFIFNGFKYSIEPANTVFEKTNFNNIYLDMNNSWSDSEIKNLKSLQGSKALIVYDDEFIKLTDENWDLIRHLQKRNFSLFPFHLVTDAQHSLVITKGKKLSPHLSDFKESKFAEGVTKFFTKGKKVFVYNLDNDVSTFVGSLRELRSIEFAQGDVAQLLNWVSTQKFPRAVESDRNIMLHNAKLIISKIPTNDSTNLSNAPDHLARLFAYNNIMRQVGSDYFKNDFINEKLVDEAATAYIVSPVSSLIVLETKEDYDRFEIKDKENSLYNASKQASGAVPEPHEWALIALFVLLAIYLRTFGFKREWIKF